MNIGKNWRIESDDMNIILLKRAYVRATEKHEAHDVWINKGYFSNLHNALKALVDYEVMKTGMRDMETIVKKQDGLYKLIEGVRR